MKYLRLMLLFVGLTISLDCPLIFPAVAQPKDDDVRAGLMPWIEKEVKAKNIPSLSIAVVDDQRVVFAASVGYADPTRKLAATPDTPYRVGSVSKPFTALLLMIFV